MDSKALTDARLDELLQMCKPQFPSATAAVRAYNALPELAEEVKRSRARIEAAPHDPNCPALLKMCANCDYGCPADCTNPETCCLNQNLEALTCSCWKSESNPAPITEPRVAEYWLIFFEEDGKEPELFLTEDAARKRFADLRVSWNCHLFRNVQTCSPALRVADTKGNYIHDFP